VPEEWKDSITVLIYENDNETDCCNYSGLSLLSATKKILSDSLLSRLTLYAEEITGHH